MSRIFTIMCNQLLKDLSFSARKGEANELELKWHFPHGKNKCMGIGFLVRGPCHISFGVICERGHLRGRQRVGVCLLYVALAAFMAGALLCHIPRKFLLP
jgi:hypothetical protein